ncbi:putative cobaltochelatase [Kitasatospora sp. NPDC001539]|uniref:putative cobaltochelatase n=1 Tax=Kitasatospora sp. NPDC001539 TaxID=3154384 RepID=UPI00332D8277
MTDVRYPFTAIVGMADLRLGLLLNAVSPAVGGVLVRGEKGTAKSTMVRALAGLLPSIATVDGCRFACDPAAPDPQCPDGPHSAATSGERPAQLVELPVGVAEDRIVGSLDLERALAEGVKAYEPGLLAKAHRGVLYIDEVNLLQDHVVDLLLDAAAMGRSYVEREGVSVRHAARFLLVGTMNPEEGELRPQLLDRFGLTVEIAATRDPAERAEVVRRRLAYDADPAGFAARFADQERELAERITAARELLPEVELTDVALRQITAVCAAFEVDGLRADIVMARTAVALAAWAGRTQVLEEDVRKAAQLALPHRRRRNPFDAPGLDEEQLDRTLEEHAQPDEPEPEGDGPTPDGDGPGGDGPDGGPDGDGPDGGPDGNGPDGGPDGGGAPEPSDGGVPAPERSTADGDLPPQQPVPAQHPAPARESAPVAAGDPYRTRLFTVRGTGHGAQGRRSPAETTGGHTVRARRPRGPLSRLHLTATLQAAAPHQVARGRDGRALVLHRDDFREQVRKGRESNLVLFVVDASGSMAARQRMTAVKGAVLSLLMDAYQRRDKIGMITFRGTGAELALPPTSSVEVGAARLESLPTGGRTPLAEGLLRAHEVLRVERLRDPDRRPLLVVVTDGRATGGGRDALARSHRAAALFAAQGTASVVLDCESGPVRLGLARTLAGRLGGSAVSLDELRAEGVASLVRDNRAVNRSTTSMRKAA